MGSIETGNIISKIRKEKNMTQKELANLLNVSDKAVSKWERGENYPDVSLLPLLSDILGVSIDELLNSGRLSNEETASDHRVGYQCLMEDSQHQYEKNWFYIFCLMSLSLFSTSFISFPYGLNIIVRIILPLFLFGVFYFVDKRYQISMERYKNYIDFDVSIINRKPYYQILITIVLQCFFILVISSINDKFINDVKIYFFSNYSLTMLFAYIINVVSLWIIIIKYSKYVCKRNMFIIFNVFINFLFFILMIAFRVYVKLLYPLVKISVKRLIFPNIIFFIILLTILILLSLLFLRFRNISLKGRITLFIISLFQNLMLVVSYNSVEYLMNDGDNYCFVYSKNIIIILLLYVSCYYAANIVYEKYKY